MSFSEKWANTRGGDGSRLGPVFLCGSAVILALLVYVNALNNPFVYDDHRTILDNATIESLGNFRAIVFHDATRPLVNLSYAVDRALWGGGPFGFHFTSVLLHATNVALVFVVALELGLPAAVVAATLFAVHPLLTEAVGYVSGRADVLSSAFFLIAFLAARRWMLRGGAGWWCATVASWVVGLLAKETAVVFPLVLFCYDVLVMDEDGRRRRWWRLHVPLACIALSAAAVRFGVFWFIERRGIVTIGAAEFLEQAIVAWRYLFLTVAPGGQTVFHDVRSVTTLADPVGLVALVGLVMLAAAAIIAPRRCSVLAAVGFGVAWFLLLLAPSALLSVLDNTQPMAERRVYLAVAGLFVAAGAMVSWAWTAFFAKSSTLRIACATTFAIIVLALGGRAAVRNIIWSDPVTLWREAADRAPSNWLPRTVLGESLHEAGRHEQAVAAYRQALTLNPQEQMSYLKLAVCLTELGRSSEAMASIEALHKIDPRSEVVPMAKGAVTLMAGNPAEARPYFEAVLHDDPSNIMALQWLAVLEERASNPAAALTRCEEVARAMPGSVSTEDCIRRNRVRLAMTNGDAH